jgi:hypothetical protein
MEGPINISGVRQYCDLGIQYLPVEDIFKRGTSLLDIVILYKKYGYSYEKLAKWKLDHYIKCNGLNLEGRTFPKVFKISPIYRDYLVSGQLILNDARMLNRMKAAPECIDYVKYIRSTQAVKGISVFRFIKDENMLKKYYEYIKNLNYNEHFLYRDYLIACKKLKKNLNDCYWLMPKKLDLFHDKIMKELKTFQEEEELKKVARLDIKIADIAAKHNINFKSPNLKITIANSASEIIKNGDKMSICVGRVGMPYVKNMANDCNLILFAYKDQEPIECIEYNYKENRLIQVRGEHNKDSLYHTEILQAFKERLGATL